MIISIIIDKLINEPKFVLFIKNNITKFIILISKAIVIKFFILFNFIYFEKINIPITQDNVPKLKILLICVGSSPLSYIHNCLKLFHNPIDILNNNSIINILFSVFFHILLIYYSFDIPYYFKLYSFINCISLL